MFFGPSAYRANFGISRQHPQFYSLSVAFAHGAASPSVTHVTGARIITVTRAGAIRVNQNKCHMRHGPVRPRSLGHVTEVNGEDRRRSRARVVR
jgi:hypothetical protein